MTQTTLDAQLQAADDRAAEIRVLKRAVKTAQQKVDRAQAHLDAKTQERDEALAALQRVTGFTE